MRNNEAIAKAKADKVAADAALLAAYGLKMGDSIKYKGKHMIKFSAFEIREMHLSSRDTYVTNWRSTICDLDRDEWEKVND